MFHPSKINAQVMLYTSIMAVAVNILMALILHDSEHEEDDLDDEDDCDGSSDLISEKEVKYEFKSDISVVDEEYATTSATIPTTEGLTTGDNTTSIFGWLRHLRVSIEKMDVNLQAAAIHILGDLVCSIGGFLLFVAA